MHFNSAPGASLSLRTKSAPMLLTTFKTTYRLLPVLLFLILFGELFSIRLYHLKLLLMDIIRVLVIAVQNRKVWISLNLPAASR